MKQPFVFQAVTLLAAFTLMDALFTPIQDLYSTYQMAGVVVHLNLPSAIHNAFLIEECVKNFAARHNSSNLHERRVVKGLQIQSHDLSRSRMNLQTLLDFAGGQRGTSTSPNNIDIVSPSARQKRGINIDLDVSSIIGGFFNGISNIFNSHKREQLASAVTNMAAKLDRHQAQQRQVNSALIDHLRRLKVNMDKTEDVFSFAFLAANAMSAAHRELHSLQAAVTPLSTGHVPSDILDPAMAATAIAAIKELALQKGHLSLVNQPAQLYRSSYTSFKYTDPQGKLDIGLIISAPIIRPQDRFSAFQFENLPALEASSPYQPIIWNLTKEFSTCVVATQQGLYPNVDNVVLTMEEVESSCSPFHGSLLCHASVRPQADFCPVALKFRERDACQAVPYTSNFSPLWIGSTLILFCAEETMLFRACLNKPPMTSSKKGLIVLPESSSCQTIFGDLAIPPRPTTTNTVLSLNRSAMPHWSDELRLAQHDLRTATIDNMHAVDQLIEVINHQDELNQIHQDDDLQINAVAHFEETDEKILLALTVTITICALASLAYFFFHAYRHGRGLLVQPPLPGHDNGLPQPQPPLPPQQPANLNVNPGQL